MHDWSSLRHSRDLDAHMAVDDLLLARFQHLIVAHTGINAAQEPKALRTAIQTRIRSLGLTGPERYLELLAAATPAAAEEWNEFIKFITNGESHFFRDRGQIALLREEILPELIARRRHLRSLRIWSAGCSTGEEPYSIAILLNELLPSIQEWDITILGTDINPAVLARARNGAYGNWSFRGVDHDIKRRYFHQHGAQWDIRSDVRSMVSFVQRNIAVAKGMPGNEPGTFDLIICRNVFIYFDRSAVANAIETFASSLAEGGYLLTGHGELTGHDLNGLRVRRYHTSVIYQRPYGGEQAPSKPDGGGKISVTIPLNAGIATKQRVAQRVMQRATPPRPREQQQVPPPVPPPAPQAPVTDEAPSEIPKTLEEMLRDGDYVSAIERGEEALRGDPRNARILALVARALANRGRYDEAVSRSREAIAADPLTVDPYYLLAHIAEDRGDLDEAKRELRSVIYIAHSAVGAYLHLADIHQREGDAARARAMRRAALGLLEKMNPAEFLAEYGESNVRDLIGQLRHTLGDDDRERRAGMNQESRT